MGMSRSRVLGALVQGIVAVTALGTPVLAGTAALGGADGPAGARGGSTTTAVSELSAENSGIPAAYAATNGAPQAPVKPTGDRALDAISSGAVFMGAMTYIGNAPNLMVQAIALEQGVRMPSFFGFMLWSGVILVPLFIIATFIFFR